MQADSSKKAKRLEEKSENSQRAADLAARIA